MFNLPVGLSIFGLLLVMTAWVSYLATIPKGTVPVWPKGAILLLALGVGMGLLAVIWPYQSGAGVSVAAVLPAIGSLLLALIFMGLLAIRKTPIGNLTLSVGDRFIDFNATTFAGEPFRAGDAFSGKRILLKFFRGGW